MRSIDLHFDRLCGKWNEIKYIRRTTLKAHLFDKELLFFVYECLHGIPRKLPQCVVFEV